MSYFYGATFLFSGLFLINMLFSYQNKHIDPAFWATLKYHIFAFPLFLIANILIGYGIKFGFKAIQNLTFVLVTSKGIEIVISLLMGYLFFKEVPTWKTLLGFFIMIVGIIVSKIK
jgi:drug/metabolite transporter (DMT)-like permease